MPRRQWLPFLVAALVVLVAPASGGADPALRGAVLREANGRPAADRTRSAELGLYVLDTRLVRTESRLGALAAERAALERERASLALRLRIARTGLRIAERRLAGRLRALYEQSDISSIEILLDARSLDEAASGLDALDRAAVADERVLAQLEAARTNLATAARRLGLRDSRLRSATRSARTTEASLRQARAARIAFLAALLQRRAPKSEAIEQLEPRARDAQAPGRAHVHRTPSPAQPVPATVAPPVGAVGAGTTAATLTLTATGYSLPGRTTSGVSAGWGVAAVDPAVIPLGTTVTVPGYGIAVAADTGGAVSGRAIDLWFPTQTEARAWGRRIVTVTLG